MDTVGAVEVVVADIGDMLLHHQDKVRLLKEKRGFFLIFPCTGQGSGYLYQQQQQQQQAVQYYNHVPGVYYPPYTAPVTYYNGPILPVDEGTLQDYIKKQMYACLE